MLGILDIKLVGDAYSQNDREFKYFMIKKQDEIYQVIYYDKDDTEIGTWYYTEEDLIGALEIHNDEINEILNKKLKL